VGDAGVAIATADSYVVQFCRVNNQKTASNTPEKIAFPALILHLLIGIVPLLW